MSDTARDYQTNDAATTNGMDDLFDVVPTTADSSSSDADTVATVSDSGSWVTVIEAASFVKKSERTIQRVTLHDKYNMFLQHKCILLDICTSCICMAFAL